MNAKVRIGGNAFGYPMPVAIVGAVVSGKPNYMTAAWLSRVNYEPPLLGVAISKRHHTGKGIRQHREFGISVPGRGLAEAADYVGLVSGAAVDKSRLFERHPGSLAHAPLVAACPFLMECRLAQIVELPSNDFYIGEIVAAYCDEKALTEGVPDPEKLRPFLLTMPDNQYWGLGERLGKAWSIGKGYRTT